VAIDEAKVNDACVRQHGRNTEGIHDINAYLARQVHDESHRDVIGPLLPGSGATGIVLYRGATVGAWGDPHVPEMAFSVTKTVVGLVAGIGFDLGLLDVDARVAETVALPQLRHGSGPGIRRRHLLQQTSQWDGELWGKPAVADAQSRRGGDEPEGGPPGSGWAYNDVRVNLLCLALTALFRRPLTDVLTDVLQPLNASTSWSWSWHGRDALPPGGRPPAVAPGATSAATCCGSTRLETWSSHRTGARTSANCSPTSPTQSAREESDDTRPPRSHRARHARPLIRGEREP
jgi:hypothetical protein